MQPSWQGATYPGGKGNEEKGPLLSAEHAQEADGVGQVQHGRAQGGDARLEIGAGRHALVRRAGAVFLAGHDIVVAHSCVSIAADGRRMSLEDTGKGGNKPKS